MPKHRKRYNADLKAKVALEAIRGHKTANEIAAEYGVHPTQIAQWKKQALDGLPDLFSTQASKQEKSEENLLLMRLLDEQYTRTPFYGTRKMTAWLQTQGYPVECKRVRRLLHLMGLEATYPKPHTSLPGATAQRYPYRLRGMTIEHCNQVWSCDITYVRLQRGFLYLMAVIDWFSRYVLAWEISVTLDTSFCLEALDRALKMATPEIFNTDQGVQFTSTEWISRLKAADIRISWDGRGRALDNVFVERLWRSVKYEEVYIKDYQSVSEAVQNLRAYFTFYNHERLHQALDYQTPAQVYLE